MPDYCGRYGSPFEVDLDYGEVRSDELFEGGVTDLWKYRALYPLSSHQYGFELSLGEGGTPLVPASNVGRKSGLVPDWVVVLVGSGSLLYGVFVRCSQKTVSGDLLTFLS
jgi:hypothetical protein